MRTASRTTGVILGMTTMQGYVDEMMARSTVQQPVRRLSGHGVFNPEAARLAIFRGPNGLTSTLGPRASGIDIAEQVWEGEPFAVDTRRTMNDLLNLVKRTSGYSREQQPVRILRTNWLNAASRIPGNPKAVVVSEALARTFWIPGDIATDREDFIRRAFGDVHAQIAALTGRTTKTQASYAHMGIKALTGRFLSSSQQYRAATQAGEAWSAYAAADVVGHRERLLTGDIALVEPLATRGTHVVVGILNSTRIKPDRRVAIFDRGLDKIGDAEVGDFGYDDERDIVTATVSTSRLAKSSLGYRELHRNAGTGATYIMGDIPFTGVKAGGYGHWARPASLPKVVRDVPLAIALAGAPTR